mmetsp:Transcript_22060/g.42360  ORF Transcript_22060/g.42360 Transcript_22060/m.42360 type:complete len:709 (+) Transcript_22060:29-2155(+)
MSPPRRRAGWIFCCTFGATCLASADDTENKTCGPEEEYQPPRDAQGWLPLHHAAKIGNVSFLKEWKELMSEGENRSAAGCCEAQATLHANTTSERKTAAHISMEYQQLEFLQWFWLMDDWLDQKEGPCTAAQKGDVFLQSDSSNKTVMSMAIDSLAVPGEFGVDALDFLMGAHHGPQLEWKVRWSPAFAEWYLNETKKIKQNIISRLETDGFGNKSIDFSSRAKQLSSDPPMYWKDETLSPEDCDAIIEDARYMMKPSAVGGQQPINRARLHEFLTAFDQDNDTVLNRSELRPAMLGLLSAEGGSFSDKAEGMQVNCVTVAKMLQFDLDGDGEVNLVTEKFNSSERDMAHFEASLKSINEKLRSRKIRTNSVFFMPEWLKSGKRATKKLQQAFGLHDWQVAAAQNLQVAYYDPGAHYGAHLDGIGRIITVFNYLSDVEEGGQTAFPKGNIPITRQEIENVSLTKECSATFNCCDPVCRAVNSTECHQALADAEGPNATRPKMTVSQLRACLRENGTATWRLQEPGLVVQPKKGSTVLWYNYDRDSHGHLEELDEAHHCGCDVKRGEKWVANLWLQDLDIYQHTFRFIRRVRVLRRAGRLWNLTHLANFADPSFELFHGGAAATQRIRSLGKTLLRDYLGLRGRQPPTFYRQCPSLKHFEGSADDLLTASVNWVLDIHNGSSRVIHLMKLWRYSKEDTLPGEPEDDFGG